MNYIYSDTLTALDNMVLDSYLIQKDTEEYFRLYRWINPTLSLGLTNNKSELNLKYIKEHNIDKIHRETGGGIVFHNEDLCFSFINNIILKPKENYLFIKNILEKSLLELGENITYTHNINMKSSICFNGSNSHEISIDNKKKIGIAQKVLKKRYLIQGSIQIKTTSLRYLLNDNGRAVVQYGLNNIDIDTVKEKIYSNFAKIHQLRDIEDENIIREQILKET